MKEVFVDPVTGWRAVREFIRKTDSGEEVFRETVFDPQNQEIAIGFGCGRDRADIIRWIRDVAETSEEQAEFEREKKKHLYNIYPELSAGAEVPNGPLGEIKIRFAEQFALWDIYLPDEDVANRRRGKIAKAKWIIWYLFGTDEKGEYLDYYASAPTVSDSHVRIHSDGQCEYLPSICEARSTSENPEEDAQLDASYYARNQQIADMLKNKGFGFDGDEPAIMRINRLLHVQKVDE